MGEEIRSDMERKKWFILVSLALLLSLFISQVSFAFEVDEGVKAYDAGDYNKAYRLFLIEAPKGNAKAQRYLGVMYRDGEGISQDYKEAMKWFKLSAEQGNSDAQIDLGFMYHKGQGVAQNYKEAVKWNKLAADQGNRIAQNNLGVIYQHGQGVAQDYKEAVKWYRLSAEQGYAIAQRNLGIVYYKGNGVSRDRNEAIKWFYRGALQGDTLSQNGLGVCYWDDKDYKRAGKWLLLAKQGNNDKASDNYRDLLKETRYGFEDEVNAIVSAFRLQPEKMSDKENKEWLNKYRTAFKKAKSSNDYSVFIVTYEDDDPDKLVPKAEDLLVKAKTTELKEQELQSKKKSQAFRAKLKVSDDTHCGMVIEIKKPLIKIQTMVGDKWFRPDQVYPPGEAGCRFVNGVYQEP